MSRNPEGLDWVLLTRYLAGDLSPAEAETVERWFEADPRHRAVLDELRAVWTATAGETAGWDTEGAVAELRRRAAGAVERRSRSIGGAEAGRRPVPSFTLARPRSWVAIAAGIAAITAGVGAGALALRSAARRPSPPVAAAARATDVVTRRAQQAEVRLADGTRVVLGAASRLTYASDFGQRERTVVLDGEGYFDVVHDVSRPFRVRAGHSVAEDVGTAFVVRARGPGPVQVVVTEGAVALRPTVAGSPSADSLLLTRGQLGRVLPDGRLVFQAHVNTDAYLAWMSGQLVFENTPLAEVAKELSRWYDQDVRVADSTVASRRFSGRFSRGSLEEAVRLVASVTDVSARRSGAGWILK